MPDDHRLSRVANKRLAPELLWRVVVMFLLASFGFDRALADNHDKLEARVKAAFVYNFTKFVQWPPHAWQNVPANRFTVGILGHNTFGEEIWGIQGKDVRGRTIEVRLFKSLSELEPCPLLFISRSEADQLEQILARIKEQAVLTVGDSAGFLQRGGMIKLQKIDQKIRFAINLAAAQAAGLQISSKLLKLATSIEK